MTAATDPRVAKNAAAHRGLAYERRTPPERCNWQNSSFTRLPLSWSDDLAYIVGLTATDGCLLSGYRKINFKSNDRELVELYLRLLGRTNRVREQRTRSGGVVHFTEFGDARLYRWLQGIGLSPRKSLTLGAIDVPDAHLMPLVRGLLDGDGSIQNFVHHPTVKTAPDYTYERLWVSFASASRAHLDWIAASLLRALSIAGSLSVLRRDGRHDMFNLRYGNSASITLLRAIYPNDGVPRLDRKFRVWASYAARHGLGDCAEGGI